MWFMLNQLDETYSALESDGVTELTGTLIILYVHLSHLVLSLTGFIVILTSPHSESSFTESLLELTIAYWHLVEVVWVVILTTVLHM